MKPDGVAFGGSDNEPFGILTPQLRGGHTHGTSFAAPFALRSAASIGAQLGTRLGPLAVRALLIHRAHTEDHHELKHVGWGRFEADPLQLVTCDDDETLVVFQGELPVGEHLRAPVPISNVTLEGDVFLAASLVIAPEVDPEHPGTYTRSGLEVAFRPHSAKFTKPKQGAKPAKHAKTRSFFSPANLYGQSETVLRDDGHKWEPCLHHEERLRSSSLADPCFDIYYHHRESGMKVVDPQPIPYAFVVSLKAPKVKDLYNRVVRAYAQQLVPAADAHPGPYVARSGHSSSDATLASGCSRPRFCARERATVEPRFAPGVGWRRLATVANHYRGRAWSMTDEILTLPEVAQLLKVAEKTVYTMAQKGELPAFKVRGQWRFKRVDLDQWIEQQKAASARDEGGEP